MEGGIKFGKVKKRMIKMAFANQDVPVLILFANHNQNSEMMSSQLQEMMPRYMSRLKIMMVTVDQGEVVREPFNVDTFPTLLYITNNHIKERQVGPCSQKLLECWIQKLLKETDLLKTSNSKL